MTTIQIRAADDADKPALLAFMAEAAGADKAATLERRWHWQWHRDPRLETPGYRAVVAVWDGRIIGNLACMPAGLYIGGTPVDAVWLVDVRIHFGLARDALKAAVRAGARKRELFPNGLAAALFDHPAAGSIQLGKHIGEAMMTIGARVGFRDVPDAGNTMRRVSLRWPLQQVVGRVTGVTLAAVADLSIRLPRRPRLPVAVLEGAFDARFDQLWEQARRDYPAITCRDSALLNWHYRGHPDTEYRVLTIADGTELRGYLVYKVWQRRGRRIARVVDLLTLPGDRDAVEALASAALHELRAAGVERADWFACGAELRTRLARLGFVPRVTRKSRPQPLMVRGLPDVPLYVTSGDGDGG
jgi:hypothetical protein